MTFSNTDTYLLRTLWFRIFRIWIEKVDFSLYVLDDQSRRLFAHVYIMSGARLYFRQTERHITTYTLEAHCKCSVEFPRCIVGLLKEDQSHSQVPGWKKNQFNLIHFLNNTAWSLGIEPGGHDQRTQSLLIASNYWWTLHRIAETFRSITLEASQDILPSQSWAFGHPVGLQFDRSGLISTEYLYRNQTLMKGYAYIHKYCSEKTYYP